MFFKFTSMVFFLLATTALAAALGGFGYLPEPSGFRWPSELGAPWAALAMGLLAYVYAGWLWYVGGVGEPQTPFGRYAKAAGVGYTIQHIGYFLVLLALLFAPQIGNWILGK